MTISQIRGVPLHIAPDGWQVIKAALPVMRLHNPCKGIRYTRNGGIRFFRFGRLQFSFCICKR